MSQQVTRIKSRIKSVSDSLKVTSAMKLVSTVKLKKWKNKMLSNREYTREIRKTTDEFLSYTKYVSPLSKRNNAEKNLYIIISSNLGLCGSYNNNVFKLADSLIKENDDLMVFGGKGYAHYQDFPNALTNDIDFASDLSDEKTVNDITRFASKKYLDGTYKEVHIIYSSYKNSLVFIAKDFLFLPLKNKKEKDDLSFAPIFEPNEKVLIDTLIPIYLKTIVFSKLLESIVCEYASRSNAMENATNNANELLDGLQIEFNKARQGAITQEIIEVVAASERV